MTEIKIPLTDVTLGETEALAAAEVIRSGWVTQGERVSHFERAFAAMVGVDHALAISNCTVGLELAYSAVGVTAGSEVIVPSLTFVATANAARRLGATAVFADVKSRDDLTLDPDEIARTITPKTRAVVAVHYAGFAADVTAIRAALKALGRTDVSVIEDCAHAPGATARDSALHCGALGDLGVFSFFGNKNLTTGEGGMLTTQADSLATTLKLARSHGMTTNTWDRHKGHAFSYDVTTVGTNARMDEMRAAIGLVQLEKLPAANARREAVRGFYLDAIRARPALASLEIPFSQSHFGKSSQHLFVVILPARAHRPTVMALLRERGIQSSVHYPPTHTFTAYETPRERVTLPVTDAIAQRLLTLPLGPSMTEREVSMVLDGLTAALGHDA